MYAFITGKTAHLQPTSVLIENQGIGYLVHISLYTYSAIKDQSEVRLYTHVVIKNESQASSLFSIYGFADEKERNLFLDLVSVSGVGNSTAQLILSSFSPDELISVIASGNAPQLQKVKGIGQKTAQRVIIDLKDKFGKGLDPDKIISSSGNTTRTEALSALLTLGFSRAQAEKVLDRVMKDSGSGASVEKLIRMSLALLAS
jgi:holliday junction DNA helicase RuvA